MKVATQKKGRNSKRAEQALQDVLERYEDYQCDQGCGLPWKDCKCPDGEWFRKAKATLPKAPRKDRTMTDAQCDLAHTALTNLGNKLLAQGVPTIELLEYYRAFIVSIIDCDVSFPMPAKEKRRYLALRKRIGG